MFPELFRSAYKVAFRLLGSREDAADCAQEACARACADWIKLSRGGSPVPWVVRTDGRLTFFAHDGRQLAQYERTGLTARLELPSLSIAAGSSMVGRVVVNNYTDQPAHATGCIAYFQVLLTNAEVDQSPARRACAQRFTFPVGESSYAVKVVASYVECSNGVPQHASPVCLSSGGAPPLPAGTYEAKLFQTADTAPPPPSIAVQVASAVSSP